MRSRRPPSAALTVTNTSCALASGTLPTRWTLRDDIKFIHRSRRGRGQRKSRSIQIELFVLAVLGPDPAHRASDRTHDNCLGFDHLLAELDAIEQRPVGDAGRSEQAVALHHVGDLILLARILDT